MFKTTKLVIVSFITASFLIPSISSAQQIVSEDVTVVGSNTCLDLTYYMSTGYTRAKGASSLTRKQSTDAITGGEVSELQNFLQDQGYISQNVSLTGRFGAVTRTALAKFQNKYGIPVTGATGPRTLAKINEVSCLDQSVSMDPPLLPVDQSYTTSKTGGVIYVNLPDGCRPGAKFSSTTGAACTTAVIYGNLIPGCTSTSGFSSVSGASCSSNISQEKSKVFCTMEARLCEDGSTMYRDASCGWHPEKCPVSVSITSSISGPVVLSPNGGETFNQTSRVTVTWKGPVISESVCPVGMYCAVIMAQSEYEISLVPFDPSCIPGVICKVLQVSSYGLEKYATGNTYSFIVASSSVPDGAYKIRVCNRSSQCDMSDSYFKIVGNTALTPTPAIPVIQTVPVMPFKKAPPTIDPCFNDIKSYITSGIPCAVIEAPQVGGVLGVSTMCVDLPINMHRGAESNDVKNLQAFLISKGLLTEAVSGFYGDSTVSAVRDYQLSKDLPVTGMVFDFTREMIRAESCKD